MKNVYILVFACFLLVQPVLGTYIHNLEGVANRNRAPAETHNSSQVLSRPESPAAEPLRASSARIFEGGNQAMRIPSSSSLSSFSRHLMCKDHDGYYEPIETTTIFSPSDVKAEFLATIPMNKDEIVEWQWYYRNDSSNSWVVCDLPYAKRHYTAQYNDTQLIAGNLDIAGYWPGVYYPRGYKVEVWCLNSSASFSEFFEVTNGGLDSPRMCKAISSEGQPVNLTSRFTMGAETQAYHYLRFDNMAYYNEETGNSHAFTTRWIQPNGSIYATHSYTFHDYKENDTNSNCWEYGLILDDSIPIDPTTPVGNWKVEVYADSYFVNDTWVSYGPIAVTPFVVGTEPVADWTFMAYLDGDNGLENASIEVFLKMANVTPSQRVKILAQLDRFPGQDDRFDNWTDCRRFEITNGMTPSSGNETQDLGEVDMGDPNTLRDFINWSINNYPANFYCLVIWDHGSGCMGVCYDASSGNDTLTLQKLSDAMTGLPVIIDDVLIDACSMTMAEVAYQIRDLANVLIGPEGLGYAPAPYENYLSALTSNSSISPPDFAKQIVNDYISWCSDVTRLRPDLIPRATMSAVDLTKMTTFAQAVDDLVTTLEEEETLQHEQISWARNSTQYYEGPFGNQFDYLVDLYSFAQQLQSQTSGQKLWNASNKLMTALSNAVIAESDDNYPGSHGLAIYFPSEKSYYDYDQFAWNYNMTAFARETLWSNYIKYHISGCTLIVQTQLSSLPVKVDNETYTTGNDNGLRLYLQPGSYTLNVPTIFSTASDRRAVFDKWSDGNTLTTRTLSLNEEVTVVTEYSIEYRLILEANLGTTVPSPGEHWYDAAYNVTISASHPPNAYGDQFERYLFKGWYQGDLALRTENVTSLELERPMNLSAIWIHQYSFTVISQFGSPSPPSEWVELGTAINESIASPVSGGTGTQHVCTGWTGTGSIQPSGTSTTTNFTLNEPSSIVWIWKTQFLLTFHTDPKGLSPQPTASPEGAWYDNYTEVTVTAQQIGGYAFQQWSTEGASWDIGVNPVTVTVDGPYDLTAHYVRAQSWWDVLTRPDVIQAVLALLGAVLTVGLLGGTWFRSRKRRDVVKAFLAEIDDVYARLKAQPKKCEEELYTLRNTILEGLTEGRVTQDDYDILDNRIDKYVSELENKQENKRKSASKGTRKQ